MLLQKSVHLYPRLEAEKAPDLSLTERSRPISLDRKCFEGLPGQVTPLAFQSG